jgi:hypothetical protein
VKYLIPKLIGLGLLFMAAAPVWAQLTDPNTVEYSVNREDRMLTPPPVSGQAYPVALGSEERANYLRYGLSFSSGYSDNALGLANGHPVSDINYSIGPTIGLDKSTARSHLELTYAPGFTFYQKTSARNEQDQNVAFRFQYRLSPHVTFSAWDSFQKTSNVLNQVGLVSNPVFGGAQGPNDSIITPIADRLGNFGNLGITYQYSRNDMIGAGAVLTNLHYPDTNQAFGVWDASSQSGSFFYTHRLSSRHYVGATYEYARLMSYPSGINDETQTHSAYLFYTVYPTRRFSMSFFGGPQLSDTVQPEVTALHIPAYSARTWAPAGGTSLDWEGRFLSAAVNYTHSVSSGGGLIGAVRLDSASANMRAQFTRALSASISGFYANNNVLGIAVGTTNGHTVSGTAALERRFGDHVSAQIGYSRIHQTYNIPVIAGTPDTNREFVSFSYNFSRPLGR